VSECFTPDSKKLITVTKDGLIVVYEAGTFQELTRTRLPRAGSTTGAAISPDGRYLLVGYRHADARLISVDQLKGGTLDGGGTSGGASGGGAVVAGDREGFPGRGCGGGGAFGALPGACGAVR
jgi:hypothetical protein